MDLGTDIKTEWVFADGDLVLIREEDNLLQAVANRLSCYQPNLEVFYQLYGGFLVNYLGRKRKPELLEFMKIEVDTIVSQDPRINDFETELSFNDNMGVDIHLTVFQDEDEDISLNLVLNGEGVVEVAD